MNTLTRSLVLAHLLVGVGSQRLVADDPISFTREIRPLLSDKCFACHGPDEQTREADLRLDVRDQALEAGAFVEGEPQESELLRRILSVDEEEVMPPPHTRKQLSPEETDLIRRWIEQGAPYEMHWSYRALQRPDPPTGDNVQKPHAIDAFLSARLEDAGLEFSPRADATTLARRLYLDLLGVPPTPEEVAAFAEDEAEGAVERLVEKLLNDQRFGERMAVYWLDLVRYADTIGYHSDTYMEVSAYRDYVIDAFNSNMPFDQFTIEQLAGDLLPNATDSQRIASGYNRLLQTTEEGGAQAKEYIAIYAADRVRNLSGVWLGSTMGCAQCHDHKYDPFSMKDFYAMAAFFADIKENAVGKRRPNMKVYSQTDRERIAELKAKIAELQLPRWLDSQPELREQLAADQVKWETQTLAAVESNLSVWQTPQPERADATGGIVLQRQDDGSYLSTKANPDRGTYTYTIKHQGSVRAVRLEAFSHPDFPARGFARGNGNFVLTGVSVAVGDRQIEIAAASADYEQPGWPVKNTLDGKTSTGWAVEGHLKQVPQRTAMFRFTEPVKLNAGDSLTVTLDHQSAHGRHLLGRFRISITDQADAGLENVQRLPPAVLAALRISPQDRQEPDTKLIREHYYSVAPTLDTRKQELAATEKALRDYEASIRTTLVTESLATPRTVRILPRGNWLDESGEIVQPAVPEFLPHRDLEGRRPTRLDLANWLVDERNPLTSRTFVNRLWKLYFGQGLSRNLDDLGGQGQAPTHPELLDWLAVEFRDHGWNVKQLVRLIVTSEAYAQSSRATPSLRETDPDNLWLARQGRWRLEAEFVRDTAIQIGGLLATEIGGKSVKPYQPAGYWQHLNFPKRSWQPDQGQQLYRRSLYTFWCRTFLHPAMLAFDASSREECMAGRARSNIPQQALVLLNDPEFLEASRAFAQRIMGQHGDTDRRLEWAFREAVSRAPSEAEMQLLRTLFENQRQRFEQAPDDAATFVTVGDSPVPEALDRAELAAWTQVARSIINLYETTSRF